MSRNQRLAMLAVAALVAVVAFAALRTSDTSTSSDTAPTVTTPSSAAPATTPPGDGQTTTATAPKPKPPAAPLLTAAKPRQLTFQEGDTARFRVRHPSAEEVHLHGYDIAKDLPAGKTITVRFKANIEGIFEVELEHSGTPLGSIRVEP